MIRRPPRSTQSRSSAASDVYKRQMGEGPARASFWMLIVGVHAMAIPMILAGLDGQPIDVYKYYDAGSLDTYNLIASIGSFVLAAGILVTLANAAYSARNGVAAGADPWGCLLYTSPSPR